MEYVRTVDFEAIEKSGADERMTQNLFDHTSGAKNCTINWIRAPAGGGCPIGLPVLAVERIFCIPSDKMTT